MKLEIPIIVGFDDIDSLLDDLKKLQTYKLFEGDEMVLVDVDDVADVLVKHIKAKEAQPKTGKWIPETEDWRNQIVWVKCSECGFDTSTSYNYCPNCGCRMDGGEQDE